MNKKIILMAFLAGILSVSCEYWEDEIDKKTSERNITEPIFEDLSVLEIPEMDFPHGTIIIDGEKKKKPFSIGKFKAGERITFQIQGRALNPRIGEEYVQQTSSHWITVKCTSFDIHNRKLRHFPSPICHDDYEQGTCEMKYRDFHGWEEHPLMIPSTVLDLKIRVSIDGNLYPLGDFLGWDGDTIRTEFTVSEGMIKNSFKSEILLIYHEPDSSKLGSVKSGFMGFGRCPGKTGKKVYNFTHNGDETQREHPQEIIEYTIDVFLEQEENQNE